MYDSILKYTGIDVSAMDEAGLRKVCADLAIETRCQHGQRQTDRRDLQRQS
jgi:lysyl-tRNA synthetase class 2